MSCCEENQLSSVSLGSEILKELKERENLLLNAKDISTFKNDGKIRIFFYGENLLRLLINPTSFEDNKILDGKSIYSKGFDKALNWEYYLFNEINEESNRTIANLIDEDFNNSDFYDVIVITVKKLLDEKSILFFSYFQNFSNQKIKQPFILFITKEEKNPNIESLFNLITNEYFDKRTIFALKFPSLMNEDETKNILQLICKFKNYYHEEGDIFESFNQEICTNYKFNILVCGRAGTGKSSFINEILGERKAKEGEGLSVSRKIVTYTLHNYPINISDTPGFESDKTVEEVKILLTKYNKKLIDAKKKINLILYFLPYSERSILGMEVKILESLMEYQTEIIFVMNFVTESIEKNHYKRIRQICEDSLKKILPEKFPIRIYPINLYSQIYEEENEEDDDDSSHKLKIIKKFGLDNLFKGIYSLFKTNLANMEDIKRIKSNEELLIFFKNNKLYNHFNQFNDLFISIRSDLSNLILHYGRLNKISNKKEKNMEELANLIFKYFTGKNCEKYNDFLEELSSKNQVEELFDKFTQSLEILIKNNKNIHTMFFYNKIHDHKTLALGYLCLKEIDKVLKSSSYLIMKNDKLNFNFIYNLCNSYNQAINGLNFIAEKYEKIYKEDNENKEILVNNFKDKISKENNSKEAKSPNKNIININNNFKDE